MPVWVNRCAVIVEMVVLPCVPATPMVIFAREISPRTCARFNGRNPLETNQAISRWSAGMAGV